MADYLPQILRKQITERAKSVCEYCKALSQFSFHTFNIDHIIPISKDGLTTFENLALSCSNCNKCKHDKLVTKDPQSNLLVDIFNPRLQKWTDHFVWNEDTTIIIGLTPTGRATIFTLKMNKPEAINLRKALVHYGVHPPD